MRRQDDRFRLAVSGLTTCGISAVIGAVDSKKATPQKTPTPLLTFHFPEGTETGTTSKDCGTVVASRKKSASTRG